MLEGGGNCLKYLKRGWNRTEGTGSKDFKKRGQAGSRGGCLKKGGTKPPYELCSPPPGFVKGGGRNQDFKRNMLMGGIIFEILVGGLKKGDSLFCVSSVGGTCQGWSIFP